MKTVDGVVFRDMMPAKYSLLFRQVTVIVRSVETAASNTARTVCR
jgi:hypothetical protein